MRDKVDEALGELMEKTAPMKSFTSSGLAKSLRRKNNPGRTVNWRVHGVSGVTKMLRSFFEMGERE